MRTGRTGGNETILDTLPKNFLDRVQRYGEKKIAMRKKEFGIWREYTWADSFQHVKYFCLGLVSLGLERGNKVCIIGDNDPEFYWAELAVQSAGSVSIGIFTDSIPMEVEYIVNHSDANFVVAQDQEQCDKLLEIKHHVPKVKHVIYWDDRGLWSYDEPWLMSFAEIEALGREYEKDHPEAYEAFVSQGSGDDMAIFSYTSGTTGLPKGAMIAHRNFVGYIQNMMEVETWYDSDDYLSFSPMAWITEQDMGLTGHVINDFVVNFIESPETVRENIREIAPHSLLFSSRLWENLVSQVQMRISDTSLINRFIYRIFMPIGYKVADMRFEERKMNLIWRFLCMLGEVALFRPLRDQLGLSRIRFAYTSGAALSPDAVRFFRAIGVRLKNLYGSTEGIVHTVHRDNDLKFTSVGKPPPGMEIKIADNGEILIKGPSVFVGYYKDPKKTAETLRDGWFHTGDAGYIDEDGHLIYLDRVKDLLQLAGGEPFSPQYIEGRLKFSPYIRDVMAIGGADKAYVTTIIIIDFDNVGRWAEKHGLAYTTFVDLSQKPEVYDLILADIERVNQTLPTPARVRKFVLLHKEFDPDEAELTRTRKLRRAYMEDRLKQMIETVYSGGEEVRVQAEVKYRDGREGIIETAVQIRSLEEA
ncbi:MAG: long-chain fatty acid--CoA ligase [Chloroflexi bacterium RBG_16_48_8]|nr:MAG: long-chain fatty acid--CoA ligase [Chloroflexi bacterium RBG_16_48_8]